MIRLYIIQLYRENQNLLMIMGWVQFHLDGKEFVNLKQILMQQYIVTKKKIGARWYIKGFMEEKGYY